MKYLKKFNNHNDYTTFLSSSDYITPNVSLCVTENEVHYNPYVHDYSQDYLTFIANENGKFKFTPQDINAIISYSTDDGNTWTVGKSVEVNSGDKVMWKGTLKPIVNYGIGSFSFSSKGNFDVQGNVMSLLFGDNFIGQTDLSGKDSAFKSLFNGVKIVSAKNLSLPATTLAVCCYQGMFGNCTSLIEAPELPATILKESCYYSMFGNCTSLIEAPELPATTLANYCYNGMFSGCQNLVNAPELPATTLVSGCYSSMFDMCLSLVNAPKLPAKTLVPNCYWGMFDGCINLSSITCLATNISESNCTNNWLRNVAASGTFTKAASMSSWPTSVNGIPSGWTVQDYSE